MNTNANIKIPFFYTSILYLLGFLLLLEWLYPVRQVTEISNLSFFIVYAVFCFLISMFQIKWWLSFILKGAAMLFIIHLLFMPYPFFSKAWLQQFNLEMAANFQSLVMQNWYDLTPLFRSLLFLLLIWLMSYLLYYWFVVMKRIFLFVLLTVVYVAILDTFTAYEADGSVIRIFIISFAALGLANMMKVIDRESIRFAWLKKAPVWILPLIAVVLFSTLVGYAAPKFDPQWPDPFPFLRNAAENAGYTGDVGGFHKVGYGEDDTRLGGSFIQDYTPVFQAATKREHYWRIETKDVYTGKGWENSKPTDYITQPHDQLSLDTFSDSVPTERQKDIVQFQGNTHIEKLLYPYGIRQVQTRSDAELLLDQHSGTIRTQADGKAISLDKYTITFDYPSFALDQLRKESAGDPKQIKAQYTQLPDGLPKRVGELAKEITNGKENRYDQAKAIERYFGQHGFRYQTSNIPVPKRDQDYVDQFLFDSQVGYCDNYSTSMVVMLRTLGIPARWAKGFTSGEKTADRMDGADDAYDVYEVTSANAHSWVEVYFPESGWVPFEPTQGFSNLADFHENAENADEGNDQGETAETPAEQDTEQKESEAEKDDQAATDTNEHTDRSSNSHLNWWLLGTASMVIIVLAFVVYRLRFRLKTRMVSMKLNRQTGPRTFQEAYHHLLKLLKRDGAALKTGQTLREYAQQIDKKYGTNEMRVLTDYYERMLYRNELDQTEIQQLNDLWKNLIRRITA